MGKEENRPRLPGPMRQSRLLAERMGEARDGRQTVRRLLRGSRDRESGADEKEAGEHSEDDDQQNEDQMLPHYVPHRNPCLITHRVTTTHNYTYAEA